MRSSSLALDSSEAASWRLKSARWAVISLTSCRVVLQKDFCFFAPCSSEYQTTPFHRPSVRLKMLPLVNSFCRIFLAPFLKRTQYHRKENSQGGREELSNNSQLRTALDHGEDFVFVLGGANFAGVGALCEFLFQVLRNVIDVRCAPCFFFAAVGGPFFYPCGVRPLVQHGTSIL